MKKDIKKMLCSKNVDRKKENKIVIIAKGKEFNYTNTEMAKWLLNNHTSFKKEDIVLDCCKGGGAFYDNIPNVLKKDWCEIDLGRDFFDYNKRVDICLSYPPSVPRKLFWGFMEKAMSITNRKIYWLINVKTLNTFTPRRLDNMKKQKWFIQKFTIVLDRRWWCFL